MGRVSCQVEKDVDAVRPDLLRQPLVARANHITPPRRGLLKAMGYVVFDAAVGVTDGLLLVPAEVLHGAEQEIAYRVPPQVGRKETPAELALRVAGNLAPPGAKGLLSGAACRRSYSAWASANVFAVTPAR